MRRTLEQLSADLEAEAGAVIEELIGWEREARSPNLSELEDKVLALRQRLGQRLLASVVEDQEAR